MSILVALLAVAANGANPESLPQAKKPAPAATACRDEQGRFRLHCLPKGTVKPSPGASGTIRHFPRDAVPAKAPKPPQ